MSDGSPQWIRCRQGHNHDSWLLANECDCRRWIEKLCEQGMTYQQAKRLVDESMKPAPKAPPMHVLLPLKQEELDLG